MMITRLLFCFAFLLGSFAQAAESVPVTIQDKGTTYEGRLYLPKVPSAKVSEQEGLPLVLVIHEWWGLTEHPLTQAERLADELGYAALAVDLFGKGRTAKTPDEAKKLTGPYYNDPLLAVSRLRKFIQAAPQAAATSKRKLDLTKTAAIGFCFGGTQALNLARAGKLPGKGELQGVVSFHGGLESKLLAKAPIEARVLVLTGKADPSVPPKQVDAFKKEMKKAGVDQKVISYPGATHAFTNPKATEMGKKFKMPIAYNREAAQKSWEEMSRFLKRLLD